MLPVLAALMAAAACSFRSPRSPRGAGARLRPRRPRLLRGLPAHPRPRRPPLSRAPRLVSLGPLRRAGERPRRSAPSLTGLAARRARPGDDLPSRRPPRDRVGLARRATAPRLAPAPVALRGATSRPTRAAGAPRTRSSSRRRTRGPDPDAHRDGQGQHDRPHDDGERGEHDRPGEADVVERHRRRRWSRSGSRRSRRSSRADGQPALTAASRTTRQTTLARTRPTARIARAPDQARHEQADLGPHRLQRLEAERVEPREEKAQEEEPEDGGSDEALRGGQLGLAEKLRGPGPLREAGESEPPEAPPDRPPGPGRR